jgi:hypothetical protein
MQAAPNTATSNEAQPTCRFGGFDIYAGKLDFRGFPPPGTRFAVIISLRSRSFGHEVLRRAFNLALEFPGACLVSVVDAPYRWNDLAQQPGADITEVAAGITRLSTQVWRRVENAAKSLPGLKLDKKIWAELVSGTPGWMKLECQKAYDQKARFWTCINTATRSVFSIKGATADLNIAGRFLLEELPVLCWLYYASPTQYIDLYPGKPFNFFRILENGGFQDELPDLTKLAAGARKFIHVDISHRQEGKHVFQAARDKANSD